MMNESEVCEMIREGLVGLDLDMASCRTYEKAGVSDEGIGLVLQFRHDGQVKKFHVTVVQQVGVTDGKFTN